MKRYLKLLLVTLVSSLTLVNTASAVSANDTFTKVESKNMEITGLGYGDASVSWVYDQLIYKFTNDQTKESSWNYYCLDPHKGGGNTNTVFKVDRVLGDPVNGVEVRGYDLAMVGIMKEVYNGSYTLKQEHDDPDYKVKGVTLTTEETYVAASIAIRSLTIGGYLWGGESTLAGNHGVYLASAQTKIARVMTARLPQTAKKIFRSAFYGYNPPAANMGAAMYDYLYNKQKSVYGNWLKEDGSFILRTAGYYGVTEDDALHGHAVYFAALELVEAGMKEAATVIDEGNTVPSITAKNSIIADAGVEGVTQKQTVTFNLEVKNFKSDGKVTGLYLSCPSCPTSGIERPVNMEYKDKNGNWVKVWGDTNILDALTANASGLINGTIQVRTTINKNPLPEGKACTSQTLTLNYKYIDSESDSRLITRYTGYLIRAYKLPNGDKITTNESYQRFLAIVDNGPGSNTLEGVATATITCLQKACDSTISSPTCSYDKTESTASYATDSNVKTCILGQKDDAGNTYQLVTTNGGVSNKYCKVYCKEDYAKIELNPIVSNVKCAGFFKLKSRVEGTKTCYTAGDTSDKSINRALFESDVKKAQNDVVDAWNEYSRWKVASQTAYTYTPSHDKEDPSSGCDPYYDGSGNYAGCDPWYCPGGERNVTLVSKEWTYPVYDYNGRRGYSSDSYYSGSPASCGCNGCSGYSGSTADHAGMARSALNELNNKIAAYERVIKEYNACTTGWTNEYKFDQEIKYFYNEYYKNDPYTSYYDLLASKRDQSKYNLIADGSLTESKDITVCLGTTNDKYECDSYRNTLNVSGTADGASLTEFNYNSNYGNTFKKEGFLECTESGCRTGVQRWVSQATFVKKEVEKKQSYITPTVFYQVPLSGKITVNNPMGSKLQFEEIYNGLPTSSKLTGGGIFRLSIQKLGEFYDTGKSGRIFDYNGTFESKSIAKKLAATGNFNGNYVCKYFSSCGTPTCPNCKFDCDVSTPSGICKWNICLPGDPDCPEPCKTCLFDFGELKLNFKTISTTNLLAANRKYGYNWITADALKHMSSDLQKQLKLLSVKAQMTIDEIEKYNELIYNAENATSKENKEFAFGIVMDSKMISKIREHNKEVEKYGGYANNSLRCESAYIDGKEYKNMYCYSTYIDELLSDITTKGNIIAKTYRNDPKQYWTLASAEFSKWKTSEDVLGGPAWK